jgi:phosphatidylserine/phosphatidylglycerophosphate/cardiolipin synthase-like enzyme
MFRLLLLYSFVILSLFGKETLYLNYPTALPSNKTTTSFGKELITLINRADNEIVFAIYGLRGQDEILNALISAKKRGVSIRGIVDSNSHNKNYYSDTHLLYEYFDIKSDHISYIMHNKFFVIDKSTVWSGSSNISDTGTGGYNANNAIVIENKKVAKVYLAEFNQMFNQEKFNSKKRVLTTLHVKSDTSTISIFFSPKSNTYKNGIKELISNAKEYIYIPIFYLTHKALSQDLIEAHKRGVDVKIILDATAARNKYSAHRYLREKGIPIKVENFGGKMHAKSIIIDDKFFITGSMNLTKAGNSKNDENTLIVKNESLTKQYKRYFLRLWREIPNKYLNYDPNPESPQSGNSCVDGIDNDFDRTVDNKDKMCINS